MDPRELFLSPSSPYRGKPLWAWNGSLIEKAILAHTIWLDLGVDFLYSYPRSAIKIRGNC
jgi:hypothetical protein